MATSKGIAFQNKFKAALDKYGFTVQITRPAYRDDNDVAHAASTITTKALDDTAREIKERVIAQQAGFNLNNDGFRSLLFPSGVSVKEGYLLKIANTDFLYKVSKSDSPIQIGDTVIYYQVQCTRESPRTKK